MFTIAIQAGGESRRMGQDKGLMLFLGKPMVVRVLQQVAHLAGELLVTTNHPDSYRFLGVRLMPDLLPGHGALGGLFTALSAAHYPAVAVVACDMPFANAGLLAVAHELLWSSGSDVVIPRTDRGLEPFHALYRRETCLPAVKATLEAGKRRVDAWFPQVSVRYLSAVEMLPFDPQQLAFRNVNTPEELHQAETLVREMESGPSQLLAGGRGE